jgi:threonine/homoserine/homoserine lactone efflux protein
MMLKFTIALLRFTLGAMLWIVVATIFGRGRMSRRVWRGLRLFRRIGGL